MPTLAEWAKLDPVKGNAIRRTIVKKFADTSWFGRILDFKNISGSKGTHSRQASLAQMQHRQVGGTWTADHSTFEDQEASLKLGGGLLEVDQFTVETGAVGTRETYEMGQLESIARDVTKFFLEGSEATSNGKQPNGLKELIGTNANHSVDEGTGPLSLANLDAVYDMVQNPTHILLGDLMYLKIVQIARAGTLQALDWAPDEFGKRVAYFNGTPFVPVGRDSQYSRILDFDETGSTTSIYVVNMNADAQGIVGIQSAPPDAIDLGLDPTTGVTYRTAFKWNYNWLIQGEYAAARLYGITNATVTA